MGPRNLSPLSDARCYQIAPPNPRLHPTALTLLRKVAVVRPPRAVQRISGCGARGHVVRG